MKITQEIIDKLNATIADMELDENYGYIGVRVQEVPFAVGPMEHCSHIWDDGNDTGEELDGVSVTEVDSLARVSGYYYGDYLAIVCGNRAEYGQDIGELVIADPVVVAIIA